MRAFVPPYLLSILLLSSPQCPIAYQMLVASLSMNHSGGANPKHKGETHRFHLRDTFSQIKPSTTLSAQGQSHEPTPSRRNTPASQLPPSKPSSSSASNPETPILRAAQPIPKPRTSRRRFSMTLHLLRPDEIYNAPRHHTAPTNARQRSRRRNQQSYPTPLHISSGLTFDSGDQLLVSAQKPLGLILEEPEQEKGGGCFVAEVVEGGAAEKAGVKSGDILVAVQNADVHRASLEEVMGRIGEAPRVVNLRFWRNERDGNWSDYEDE